MSDIQKDLEDCLAKRDRMRDAYIARVERDGRTRARTTTFNASTSNLNERIALLRQMLKQPIAA